MSEQNDGIIMEMNFKGEQVFGTKTLYYVCYILK